MSKKNIVALTIAALSFSKKFQPREELNKEAVSDYTAQAKDAKAKGADFPFPELRAVKRGDETIVYSGFHRGAAARAAEYDTLQVDVKEVGPDFSDLDIFQLAIQSNAEHGVRATNADKLHNLQSVLKMLGADAKEKTNVALAELSGTTEGFVRSHRPAEATAAVRTTKKGKMNVSRVGKKGGKAPKAAKAPKAKKGAQKTFSGTVIPPAPRVDELYVKALDRIVKTLGDDGAKFHKAVTEQSLDLSVRDIKDMSGSSENRIRRIYPLVADGPRWKPAKAYAFIDKDVTSDTKLADLQLLAATNGGTYTGKVDGFNVTVAVAAK